MKKKETPHKYVKESNFISLSHGWYEDMTLLKWWNSPSVLIITTTKYTHVNFHLKTFSRKKNHILNIECKILAEARFTWVLGTSKKRPIAMSQFLCTAGGVESFQQYMISNRAIYATGCWLACGSVQKQLSSPRIPGASNAETHQAQRNGMDQRRRMHELMIELAA